MLSAQRVGAIVAIERQIGLRNYIEGGIPLDAVLTYDLIVSIFQPKSPLHDGAVIIQEDRVAAAACFLPLTVNPKLSKELGSRHRAAIGLTEENDSIAIVVSEETGSISLVVDGQIERGLYAEALRSRLRSLVLNKRRRASARCSPHEGALALRAPRAQDAVGRHAILLWLFVSGDETVERGLRVPLEFQQFPGGIEMMGEAPSLVDVRVRGGTSTLSRLGPGDIVAQLDLKAARVGRRLYQITPEQVRVPFGVQVIQVTPPTIVLAFEISATRQVPVVPELEGEPAPGFVVGEHGGRSRRPWKSSVHESAIASVSQATTEPVSVAGASAAVKDSVTIGLLDSSLRLKTPRWRRSRSDIIPGPVERSFRERPVHLQNLGNNLLARATPNAVDVVLRGSREGVGGVDTDEVVASVDLTGLGAGNYTLPVHVESPQRCGRRARPAGDGAGDYQQ